MGNQYAKDEHIVIAQQEQAKQAERNKAVESIAANASTGLSLAIAGIAIVALYILWNFLQHKVKKWAQQHDLSRDHMWRRSIQLFGRGPRPNPIPAGHPGGPIPHNV